jgi:hypothetical protein
LNGVRRASVGNAALVLALAMALWVASTLGFMHRVVHTPGSRAVASSVASSNSVAPMPAIARVRSGVAALFGPHDKEDDCRLYDQLAGGFAMLSVPTLALPIAMPMARFHFFLGEAIARWVALFDARGPPVTR